MSTKPYQNWLKFPLAIYDDLKRFNNEEFVLISYMVLRCSLEENNESYFSVNAFLNNTNLPKGRILVILKKMESRNYIKKIGSTYQINWR